MIKAKVTFDGTDAFTAKVKQLSAADFRNAVHSTVKSIYNRGKMPGGTPVRTGQLRQSLGVNGDEVGYGKEYAPAVEYGRRTANGGMRPGRYYLQANVNAERPLFKQRIKNAMEGKKV